MDLFDRIISKEIDSQIVYEDKNTIAILDIKPKRRGHTLVIPKKHSKNFIDINDEDLKKLIIVAKKIGNDYIKKEKATGYNIEVNINPKAGQEIMHTHIHVIPTW